MSLAGAARGTEQQAYVLHQRPYRETSVIAEMLTPGQGRIGLVARGVRGARPRLARGVLNPFAPIQVSYHGSGELALLTAAEPCGLPHSLQGPALMCGLYVNELLVRLLPRHDPHPGVWQDYAALLGELAAGGAPAWPLRRFERDLLTALGYAPLLAHSAGHAAAIDPAASYSYDPERGPVPATQRREPPLVSGRALLALAGDSPPGPELLPELKRLMRALLRHALGGRELNAWRTFGPR